MTDQSEHDGASTQRSVVSEAADVLLDAGVERARQEARWIVQEVLGCSGASLAAHPDRSISADAQAEVHRLLARRASGEPLQYVLGHADFRGLRLRVTPDVMIPRPETEGVVSIALKAVKNNSSPRVCDVGTGSGCIALALKQEQPQADVYACDVSAAALRVARENAERLDLDVSFFAADVLRDDFPERAPDGFDLIVSNPPYVVDDEADSLPGSVVDYEPAEALFAGEDPFLFYRALCRHARSLLRSNGALVVETHAAYGAEVRRVCQEYGLRNVQLHRDLTGRERIVMAQVEADIY